MAWQMTIFDCLEEPDRKNVVYDADDLWTLYNCLKYYRNTYWDDTAVHFHELSALMDEVGRVFARDWPDLGEIYNYKPHSRTRNAGRKKVYDTSFDREIIRLHVEEKFKPGEIVSSMKCGRSYVYSVLSKYKKNNPET